MKHFRRYLVYVLLAKTILVLPIKWLVPLSLGLAKLSRLVKFQKHVVMTNLEIAFGDNTTYQEREHIYEENLKHMWLGVLETLGMSQWSREFVSAQVSIEGWEYVEQAHRLGKGVLMLGGHFGNWELHNIALAINSGLPYYSYTGKQRNPYFDRAINNIRRRLGIKPIGQSPASGRQMIEVLKNNQILALAADQNIKNGAIFIPFFGRKAALAQGMGALAVKLQAPVFFSWMVRTGPFRHRLYITPLNFQSQGSVQKDIEALSRCYVSQLENVIRAHPEQYLWMYKRYKLRPSDDPEPVY